MSEYAGSRKQPQSIDDLDNTGTLFEQDEADAELDRVVDTHNISYDDARQRLGLEKPSLPHVPEDTLGGIEGIAISLDDRAVALESIVRYYNKANQTRGSRTHIDNGGQQMSERYGPEALEDVQHGAEVNRDKLVPNFNRSVGVLAGVDQMRARGDDDELIELERLRVQMDLNRNLGGRGIDAALRNSEARNARRVADYTSGRKKPRRRPVKKDQQ